MGIEVNKDWTLFLDRDGVINVENKGTYITDWSEFKFCDGALEALSNVAQLFGNIIVVTNQRGVGRGIMSIEDLKDINSKMVAAIANASGRIDKVYACTALEDDNHNRKPNTGMGEQAKEDFSNIDFSKSVMVGNNLSDMEFGKRQSMHTVFLTTTNPPFELPHDLIDEQHASLLSWTEQFVSLHISEN